MSYPLIINKLISAFSQLPSVGPKTAERYVFYLLENPDNQLFNLTNSLKEIKEKITNCSRCLTLTDQNPCLICKDKNRDTSILCLVENTQDLWTIENTKQFFGKYFVLGKLINPIAGITPDKLPIKEFLNLLKVEKTQELIIALNFTMEGESTTLYLKKYLNNLKITRLAKGLPSGSDLEYADSLTLKNALKHRQEL